MLELVGVSKSFYNFNPLKLGNNDTVEILKNINFKIFAQDIVGIIGKNGSGKSTLLKLLFGALQPESGEIKLNGSEELYREELKKFSLINSNERSFFWRLSLRQNLNYFESISKKHNREIIELLLEDLSITNFLDKPFYALSSGEKKKALLYRGLLKDPKIIFFDLPSKNQISDFIQKLNKDFNKTIFWVTHDLSEVQKLCNKVLIARDKTVKPFDITEDIKKISMLENLLIDK